jgi:WD40 repeat protein
MKINANQVATASDDTSIKVWDISTNTLVSTFYGHSASVTSLTSLPGGLLASGSTDKTVMVWNMVAQTVTSYNMSCPVKWIKMHPTVANTLLVWCTSTSLSIYNPSTNMTKVATVNTTDSTFNDYWSFEILAPSGNVLALGRNSFWIYNVPSLTTNFTTTAYNFHMLARSKQLSDNMTVVIGEWNNLFLYNSSNNSFGASYSVPGEGSFTVIELTPDNLFLITVMDSGHVFAMWTWTSMSLTQVRQFVVNGMQYGAAFIPQTGFDGSKIFIFF